MRVLERWQSYTREEVHDIFSPNTPFTPQRGTWGLQGIVRIPDRPDSFVFFVTFGQKQAGHAFDESITEDGVLTWQSQPSQRLTDRTIGSLIEHDDRVSALHLFLRPRRNGPYVYCGELGYLSHDTDREQPVHFQWQLMDWPPPKDVLAELSIQPIPTEPPGEQAVATQAGGLTEVPRPRVAKRGGRRTPQFLSNMQATHPDQSARNAALGLAGETLVLEMERQRLISAGRPDLAERIVHVAVVEGDAAGYDILSYEPDETPRLIEVKTTRGAATAAFFVSPNEIELSRAQAENYVLIRVFGYDGRNNKAGYFQIRGALADAFDLAPTEYRASLMPDEGIGQ